MPMISESIEFEAPFFDVDSCQIVWHGNYVKYFELARCKLLDKIGYNYKDMEASGYTFPVVELHVKYVGEIKFTQEIRVEATLKEWEHKLKICYRIYDNKSQKVLTKAETVQVAVSLKSELMQFDTPAIFQDRVTKTLEKEQQSL